MGAGSWNPSAYAAYASTTVGKSTKEVFTRSAVASSLSPKGVAVRESRDSDVNPNSTPIIVALDVTGSMGEIARIIASKGLGTLFSEILARKPVTDPHLMFMAVGDANCDRAPLQVSQFEADERIIEQLTDIFVEGGGGGNDFESYNLAWYFAGFHTSHDAFEKRGKKGYLFTIGDECVPGALTKSQVEAIVGDDLARDMSSAEMLQAAQRLYHVFHLTVEESTTWQRLRGHRKADEGWRELLGQNVLPLSDYSKLAEVVVSAIQVVEGADRDAVAGSWSGDTSLVVANAVRDLAVTPGSTGAAVTRF